MFLARKDAVRFIQLRGNVQNEVVESVQNWDLKKGLCMEVWKGSGEGKLCYLYIIRR